MRVMAQIAMVMNLDKCIGCHTCSVTCKQAWTNRTGTEYVWFNNVETRPGQGFPRRYEDQDKWRGGWELNRAAASASGGRARQKPRDVRQPRCRPERLLRAVDLRLREPHPGPPRRHLPVAPPRSSTAAPWRSRGRQLGRRPGRRPRAHAADPLLEKISDQVRLEYRAGVHVLPAAHLRALPQPLVRRVCPSGAIYKRIEDGIVLVDQDRCRGWRMCVSGCPYKKVYFNHHTGKAEKCTFCYPRIEVGIPPSARRPASGGCATWG